MMVIFQLNLLTFGPLGLVLFRRWNLIWKLHIPPKLRVSYGCSILIRSFNKNKLELRSAQCVFLGFAHGYKGVICYDIKTRKFILSRHVLHDEDVYPFKQVLPSKDSTATYRCSQTPVLIQLQVPSARVLPHT
ncbi:hypothetical protein ACFX11_002585 [Malus domestica]